MATPKSAFISYRRKDSADISGRLFDRLSGYFGPESTLLDIDALVSGSNYRTQIEQLLERCNVVLAVIGQEWLTVLDDQGQRRIDNPDDQLRIEIEVALKSGRTVIPVLVHDAELPQPEQLPEELRELSALDPHYLQSGSSFNTDIQLLVERLVDHGLHPPESNFPWHTVLLPLGISAVLFALYAFINYGPRVDTEYTLQQISPNTLLHEIIENTDKRYDLLNLAKFDHELIWTFLLVTFPLALGSMLIVWGKRLCCLSGERLSAQRHYAQGAGRLLTPKSTKSVWCLALGLASISTGLLTAIPSLIMGIAAWREIRVRRSWMRGRSLVIAGLLGSLLGVTVFNYIHLPFWGTRSWVAAMERAKSAEDNQQLDVAEIEYDTALRLSRSEPRKAVTRVRRATIFLTQNRDEEAETNLTSVIDSIELFAVENPSFWRGNLIPILTTARAARAEVYQRLGDETAAELDRNWDHYTWNPGEDPPSEDFQTDDEMPLPPAPVPSEPPAPAPPSA